MSYDLLLSLQQAVGSVHCEMAQSFSRRINNLHGNFWMRVCSTQRNSWAEHLFFYSTVDVKKYTVRSLSYTNCESALLISTAAVLLSHKASSSKVTFYWNVFWQPQSVLQLCFLQETVLVSQMELSFSSRFPSFVSLLLNSFRSSPL